MNVRRSGDIASEFATLNGQADGLYIVADALTAANSTPIITLALAAQLPTILNTSNYVRAGALMSYGPDLTDQFRRAANVVDKILTERSRAISRWNSRPNSNSSSISRPPKLSA